MKGYGFTELSWFLSWKFLSRLLRIIFYFQIIRITQKVQILKQLMHDLHRKQSLIQGLPMIILLTLNRTKLHSILTLSLQRIHPCRNRLLRVRSSLYKPYTLLQTKRAFLQLPLPLIAHSHVLKRDQCKVFISPAAFYIEFFKDALCLAKQRKRFVEVRFVDVVVGCVVELVEDDWDFVWGETGLPALTWSSLL